MPNHRTKRPQKATHTCIGTRPCESVFTPEKGKFVIIAPYIYFCTNLLFLIKLAFWQLV